MKSGPIPLLLVAVIACCAPGPTVVTSSPPAATSTPTATTAGSARPTGTPGGSAVYNDDFGFIVPDVGPMARIRTESGSTLQGFSFSLQGFAVSVDGKYVAYWTLGTGARCPELRMFTTLGNATEQTLATLDCGQRGGGIAWSSDGAGLLYSTETGNFGVGGGTNSATLNVYEFAVGGRRGTAIDSQTNTGWLYRPVAWDRSANIAAAGLTGEGAGMAFYVSVRINPDNTFTRQQVDTKSRTTSGMLMASIHASSDARFVLGVDLDSGEVKFWPVSDYGANKTASGTGKTGALWQPGTHKIGFISADGGFVLFTADDGSASTAFRGVKASSSVRTFRADGTAVVLAFVPQGSTGLGATDYTLTRLADGASVTFQDVGGLAVSVRLR